MLKSCPSPVDVQDLQFKLHCRFKCFENSDPSVFSSPHSLISVASRYGLLFVGTNKNNFQVITTRIFGNYNPKDKDVKSYPRRLITLPSSPKHVSVNCDSTILAVVIEEDNSPWTLFYDVSSFYKKDVILINKVRLSATPNVKVREVNWNPSLPSVFTACKSDGSLGVYELKEKSVDINELPSDSGSTTFCWSPKGKQIAVGSKDGRITQYKPDLKAVKIVNQPPLEGPYSLISLQWVSNYQFIGIYQSLTPDGSALLIAVDSPKTGECSYTNYDDICYSGSSRSPQFFMILQAHWNILMVASSNSTELGVMGSTGETWTQWIVPDSARAELPLSSDHQETLPVGLTLDISNTKPLPWGESMLPPCPQIILLSHEGVLCLFDVVNLKPGIPSICSPPDSITDTSGLSQFVTSEPSVVNIPGPPEYPVSNISVNPKPTLTSEISSPSMPSFGQKPGVSLFGGQSILTPLKTPIVKPLASTDPSSPGTAEKYSSIFSSLNVPQTPSNVTLPVTPIKVPPADTTVSSKAQVQDTRIIPVPSKTNIGIDLPDVPVSDPKAEAEKQALLQQMIRDECVYLEAELKALLYHGRLVKINLGTDAEKSEMVEKVESMRSFLKEILDINTGQSAEIHYLKQSLVQSWAWYEEARSRYHASKDETIATLLRSQPLDSAAEKRLKDIHQMKYYIESQLSQASKALDEQWDNFQDYAKKTHKIQMPTMEAIFQTMVRQDAILQKQSYILKDIAMRIRKKARTSTGASLLVHIEKDNRSLVDDLKNMSLHSEDIFERQYAKILDKNKSLSANKTSKLRRFLKNRPIVNVPAAKPLNQSLITATQSSTNKTRHMISILGAQLSPVQKPPTVKNLEFIQSTPLRDFRLGPKTIQTTSSPNVTINSNVVPPVTSGFISLAKSGPVISNTQGSAFVAASQTFSVNKMFPVSTQVNTVSSESAKIGLNGTGGLSSPSITSPKTFEAPSTKSVFSFSSGSATTKSAFSFTGPQTVKPATTTHQLNTSSGFSGLSSQIPSFSVEPTLSGIPKTSESTFISPGFSFNQTITTSPAFDSQKPIMSITSKSETKSVLDKPTPQVNTSTTGSLFGNWSTLTSKPLEVPKTPNLLMSKIESVQTPETTSVASVKTSPLLSFNSNISKIGATTATVTPSFTNSVTSANVKIGITPTTVEDVKPSATSIFSNNSSPSVSTGKTFSFLNAGASMFGSTTVTTQSSIFGNSASMFGASVSNTPPTFGFQTSAKSLLSTTTSATRATSQLATTAVTTAVLMPADSSKISDESHVSPSFPTTVVTSTITSSLSQPSIFQNLALSSAEPIKEAERVKDVEKNKEISTPTTQTPIFGNIPLATSPTSMFGSAPATSNTVPATQQTSIFGNVSSTYFSKPSIFGNLSTISTQSVSTTTAVSSSVTPGSIFSNAAKSTPPQTSIFGSSNASAFGATSSSETQSVFGGGAPASQNSVFGSSQSSIFASTAAIVPATSTATPFGSGFGAQTSSAVPPFGQQHTGSIFSGTPKSSGSVFGSQSAFASSNVFGENSTTTSSAFGKPTAFGSSIFGAPTTSATNVFGNTNTSSTFGTGFGNTISAGGAFSTPGTSQASSFSFASAANNTATTGSFALGNLSLNSGSSGGSLFGSSTGGFGQPQLQNPFGKTTPSTAFGSSSSNVFGNQAATSSSPFTSNAGSTFGGGGTSESFGSSAFGSPSVFGQQKPAFGQSAFGGSNFSSPQQPGSFSSGSGAPIAQTGFGSPKGFQKPSTGFGSPPTFGGSPAFGTAPSFGAAPQFGSAPTFGSPGKIFGSSSPTGIAGGFVSAAASSGTGFENLANQNTIGFGNLAQQAAAPNSTPFTGASSFSSWR